MLKLFTGWEDASLISATIELESMPPDRNAPNGTSAINCRTTAVRSAALNASAASSSCHSFNGTEAASQ
jgi:hypothetical protein